jgi:hypothetical protein
MEQRSEPRFAANQVVPITILGDLEVNCTGTVKDATGKGLGLEMAIPIGIGTALKIHLPDAMMLGEVIYSANRNGSYFVGVELQHALFRLSELSEMSRGFEGDFSGLEKAHSVSERRR